MASSSPDSEQKSKTVTKADSHINQLKTKGIQHEANFYCTFSISSC